jgi:hypothetical protein
MSLAVGCKCGWSSSVSDTLAGKLIQCAICRGPVRVPALANAAKPTLASDLLSPYEKATIDRLD